MSALPEMNELMELIRATGCPSAGDTRPLEEVNAVHNECTPASGRPHGADAGGFRPSEGGDEQARRWVTCCREIARTPTERE